MNCPGDEGSGFGVQESDGSISTIGKLNNLSEALSFV
jgi:hypothetical protein